MYCLICMKITCSLFSFFTFLNFFQTFKINWPTILTWCRRWHQRSIMIPDPLESSWKCSFPLLLNSESIVEQSSVESVVELIVESRLMMVYNGEVITYLRFWVHILRADSMSMYVCVYICSWVFYVYFVQCMHDVLIYLCICSLNDVLQFIVVLSLQLEWWYWW